MIQIRMAGLGALIGLSMSGAAFPAATPAAAAAGMPAALLADPAHSQLEFAGVQAGAPFKGGFKKFTASVSLDPQALASSRIDVQIDLNSLDSQDEDRDKSLRGADFFDVLLECHGWP